MEEAEMVGPRTRARARALASTVTKRKPQRSSATVGEAAAVAAAQEAKTRSYIRQRSRSRGRGSLENSPSATLAEKEGMSPLSSYGSSEVVYEDQDDGSESSQTTRETTPVSSELLGEADYLETTDGSRSIRMSTRKLSPKPTLMPRESEVEEFFAAVERDERRRFSEKYNYDIAKDVPLDGRFEWCPISKS